MVEMATLVVIHDISRYNTNSRDRYGIITHYAVNFESEIFDIINTLCRGYSSVILKYFIFQYAGG